MPSSVEFIAYDTIKGASSHLFVFQSVVFLNRSKLLFSFWEEPFAERPSWVGWEPKFLNSLLPRNQTQGSRHRLGVHVPSRWNFTLQSWSSGQVRDGCSLKPKGPSSSRLHTNKPNAGILWKHVLTSSLHLSSSDVGLASACPVLLPPPTPPTQWCLNLYVQLQNSASSSFQPLSPWGEHYKIYSDSKIQCQYFSAYQKCVCHM